MAAPFHIVYLLPGFAANEEDTSVLTYFQNFLRCFREQRKDLRITIVSLFYPDLREIRQWHGMEVHYLGGKAAWRYKPGNWWRSQKKLKEIHQTHKIDLVNSLFFNEPALLGNLFCGRNNIRHVCTLMGTEVIQSRNRYFKLISPQKLHPVFLSHWHYEQSDFKPEKYDVVSYGIEKPMPTKNQERAIDIIGVSFLNKVKNIPLFIGLISALVKEKPNLRVKLIGEDYSEGKFPALIRKHQIEKNIEMTGLLSNREVLSLMEHSKVLLHTSNFESQGYVFLEALSKGMSIVSKQVGIATASDRWHIGQDQEELLKGLKQALAHHDHQALQFIDVNETINNYLRIYGLKGKA